jgi:hypothetical protein
MFKRIRKRRQMVEQMRPLISERTEFRLPGT